MPNKWCLNTNNSNKNDLNNIELFLNYKPQISESGLSELDNQKLGFDSNIYNILKYCTQNSSISKILSKMYFSLVEISNLFLLCVRQNLISQPEKEIVDVAEFLVGKNRIGEYLINSGKLSNSQLTNALNYQKNTNKKIGEICVHLGYMSAQDLKPVVSVKENSQKRFVADDSDNLLSMVK